MWVTYLHLKKPMYINSGLQTLSGRTEGVFHTTGFSNWNDPGRNLKMHSNSQFHKELQMKLDLVENSIPVNAMLNQMEKESRVTANNQLVVVIRALQLLSRQNVALRGNITEVYIFIVNYQL